MSAQCFSTGSIIILSKSCQVYRLIVGQTYWVEFSTGKHVSGLEEFVPVTFCWNDTNKESNLAACWNVLKAYVYFALNQYYKEF